MQNLGYNIGKDVGIENEYMNELYKEQTGGGFNQPLPQDFDKMMEEMQRRRRFINNYREPTPIQQPIQRSPTGQQDFDFNQMNDPSYLNQLAQSEVQGMKGNYPLPKDNYIQPQASFFDKLQAPYKPENQRMVSPDLERQALMRLQDSEMGMDTYKLPANVQNMVKNLGKLPNQPKASVGSLKAKSQEPLKLNIPSSSPKVNDYGDIAEKTFDKGFDKTVPPQPKKQMSIAEEVNRESSQEYDEKIGEEYSEIPPEVYTSIQNGLKRKYGERFPNGLTPEERAKEEQKIKTFLDGLQYEMLGK